MTLGESQARQEIKALLLLTISSQQRAQTNPATPRSAKVARQSKATSKSETLGAVLILLMGFAATRFAPAGDGYPSDSTFPRSCRPRNGRGRSPSRSRFCRWRAWRIQLSDESWAVGAFRWQSTGLPPGPLRPAVG